MKDIKKIDKANMLDILLDLPRQCETAIKIANSFALPDDYKHSRFNKIVFAGVGGSGIGADIVRTYVSRQLKIPVMVNRNYGIPAFVDKDTLVFVCSYSGETEETLAAYKQIKETGAKVISITSGGALHDMSIKDGVPCVLIPRGLPPRTAIGYMTIVPLSALADMKLIENQEEDLKETVRVLEELKEKIISPEIPVSKNTAKQIASKAFDRFLIIYAPEDFLGSVATRWRQEFEENAKIVCSTAVLPEMNHNEVVGWQDPRHITKDFAIVILRDKDEHPRVSRRIEITRQLIARRTGHIMEIHSHGKSLLARTFSLIYIGTFASFYLAVLNGVDPTPVDNVTYLKNRLVEK